MVSWPGGTPSGTGGSSRRRTGPPGRHAGSARLPPSAVQWPLTCSFSAALGDYGRPSGLRPGRFPRSYPLAGRRPREVSVQLY